MGTNSQSGVIWGVSHGLNPLILLWILVKLLPEGLLFNIQRTSFSSIDFSPVNLSDGNSTLVVGAGQMLKFGTPSDTSGLAFRGFRRHGRGTSLVSALGLLLWWLSNFTLGEGLSRTDIISEDPVVISRCEDSVITLCNFNNFKTPNLTIAMRSHNDIRFAFTISSVWHDDKGTVFKTH